MRQQLGITPAPPEVELSRMHAAQRNAVLDFARGPRRHEGRGIVTAIYRNILPSAWILLSELVRMQVAIPVEAFYREGELSQSEMDLLASLGLDIRFRLLSDKVAGFAVKPFAIWRSSFREVLWLDGDNYPIRDPSFLFDDPEYQQKGSLFWRDVTGTDRAILWHPSSPVWRVFNVPPNDAEEFETGQLLVDKEKRWAELGLTVHFAEHARIYYQYVHGDKDTFRLAWQNLAAARKKPFAGGNYLSDPSRVPYGFMPYGPFHMGRQNPAHKWGGGTVMVQRDREGVPLFNHRNYDKFSVAGENPFNRDITNEPIYHEHLRVFRTRLVSN